MDIKTKLKAARIAVQPGITFWKAWSRPLTTYGIGVAILGIYFIDWRLVATKIPFYRKKFDEPTIE
ncbi:unnamed protein product [Mesocestoides corti]|uniref:Ubiquinol-cytochrome c reductase complex 9.5 kDa protein n=1 Tax=Mesocestoides corti TaxID=53468 RepID=A0A0R3U1X4_MESCO|nr:unnamed protein product [Mesocestoides corti]